MNIENLENLNNDKQNPNKITFIEYLVFLLLLISIIVYVSPNFLLKLDKRRNAQIQTNASIFTSKVLSEFSTNKKVKASLVAKKIAEELNSVNKNPYSKNDPAYSIEKQCPGCVIITFDDKVNSVIAAGYGKDGTLLVRTLIQPPSFVTYTKDLSIENKKVKNNGNKPSI